ncbi:MAG: hypothetical protein KGJ09_03310 [Candidatus Omnitrophica bacterium]|nr:hypothetical protein [Candidatus Omnitrophota bacterium]MDE2009089.1 hypothetical protein [Candidatus Omnitrophota bacterium]MDE2214246.1 hypothetical protein [Candidatus Omnitrophota bacterium]MDE2231283.1 hypothetical protein [Candidatus Omnitrophota bacterium]
MAFPKKRKIFSTSNPYEVRYVLLAFLPGLLALLSLAVALLYVGGQVVWVVRLGHHINFSEAVIAWITAWYRPVIILLCGLYVLSVVWAFNMARNVLGAFTRLIPEMDAIIEGRSQKLLTARPGDRLAQELLKRINVFVRSYIAHQKSGQ